ncbi:hypothetical protein [Curtobacterium sp. RRHDQ10]|uniref:hypothetical protein n=1 Tax=Curtobacterium phyllosphaerae TaxID=3413379 RepID=UPI003BF1C68C
MTDVTRSGGPAAGLQTDGPGLEARSALVSLLPSGGAPVCAGDACSAEVPD